MNVIDLLLGPPFERQHIAVAMITRKRHHSLQTSYRFDVFQDRHPVGTVVPAAIHFRMVLGKGETPSHLDEDHTLTPPGHNPDCRNPNSGYSLLHDDNVVIILQKSIGKSYSISIPAPTRISTMWVGAGRPARGRGTERVTGRPSDVTF